MHDSPAADAYDVAGDVRGHVGNEEQSEVGYIRRVVRHHGAKALTDAPKVHLSTIHAAKGGEADHVVLLTDLSRVIHREIQRDPDHERRVFYVGLTRARTSLQVVGFDNPLFSHH